MNKKLFRHALSILSLLLVAFVVYQARDEISTAFTYLQQTNLWFILLLIPEQILMYFCVGQMFFSYLTAKKNAPKVKFSDLIRISFELNFVNHAIPSGGVAGLGYITWRLKKFGSSYGQTSFMYILRYVITILANQLQVTLAILILLISNNIPDGAMWVVWLSFALSFGIIAAVIVVIIIASSKKRIKAFARFAAKFLDKVVQIFTFNHKKQALKHENIEQYFLDLHDNLILAKKSAKILVKPILWGLLYSFCEVATYWLVATSMGHPEILPQFMVAEAIASAVGAVFPTPGGVGGYEGTMVLVVAALGVDAGLATAIVITTRALVLVGTIVTGYGFYQSAISKIGKKDREKIAKGEYQ